MDDEEVDISVIVIVDGLNLKGAADRLGQSACSCLCISSGRSIIQEFVDRDIGIRLSNYSTFVFTKIIRGPVNLHAVGLHVSEVHAVD